MKLGYIALVLMLVSSTSWGKRVENLYDAKALVQNQSLDVRKQAAKKGLADVLLRLSGSQVPADNPAIKKAMRIADQYLYQFSYSQLESHEWSEQTPPGSSWLNMRFEGKALNRILKQAKLPIWGAERPTMLVWLAVGEDNGDRLVITEGSEHPALQSIKSAMQHRGVPLILPVYDLEDAMQLPSESLWGLFTDVIQTASQRYAPESVLAGRVYQTDDGRWFGHWKFIFRGKEQSFVDHADSLDDHVLMGVSRSAEALANVFSIKPSQGAGDTIAVSISGINSLEQYANVTKYLKRLTAVSRVEITGLDQTELNVSLKLAAQYQQFEQALKLDRKLVAVAQPQPTTTEEIGQALPQQDVGPKKFKWRP